VRKLSHPELLARQQDRQKEPRLPFCVVLNDIRSLYNVGSIFRTADGIGVEKIWICGITGFPPDTQITKTALGAEKEVPWEYREDVRSVVRKLKSQGYQIVLLEQVAGSIPYQDYEPAAPVCLIVGNEVTGVSEKLLSLCDQTIEIEMAGLKNSLNVSVAFGVAAFHIGNLLRKDRARSATRPPQCVGRIRPLADKAQRIFKNVER
jgi:tRNA G18 (ribose-2'-O)-methylase SpoU